MKIAALLIAGLGVVAALENGLVRTPPMGWMSWTRFYCEIDCKNHPLGCINEDLYKRQADSMIADGYRDVGYDIIHIDDCWAEKQRDAKTQKLVPDHERFGSGMDDFGKYLHDRGLQFATYADYGTLTCGGYPGSQGFEKIDSDTFADWKVDYLKLDGCYSSDEAKATGYPLFEQTLNATGRPIVYSCSWPAYLIDKPELVNYTTIAKWCNLWRNYNDIDSSWGSIKDIIQYYIKWQDKHIPSHGPGHWHDPDMLVIGNDGITEGMARIQMSVWVLWSAPLIMSNDLPTVLPEFREILQNKRAIAIDQDQLGIMGRMVKQTDQLWHFVKKITPKDGDRYSYAIGVINYSDKWAKSSFTFAELGVTGSGDFDLECVWGGKSLGRVSAQSEFNVNIPPLDAKLLIATIRWA